MGGNSERVVPGRGKMEIVDVVEDALDADDGGLGEFGDALVWSLRKVPIPISTSESVFVPVPIPVPVPVPVPVLPVLASDSLESSSKLSGKK